MIAPETIEALADVANALGFTLYRGAIVRRHIGIDAARCALATLHPLLRLGSDPKRHATPIEFEGTARECAAFLIGWRDRGSTHIKPEVP